MTKIYTVAVMNRFENDRTETKYFTTKEKPSSMRKGSTPNTKKQEPMEIIGKWSIMWRWTGASKKSPLMRRIENQKP